MNCVLIKRLKKIPKNKKYFPLRLVLVFLAALFLAILAERIYTNSDALIFLFHKLTYLEQIVDLSAVKYVDYDIQGENFTTLSNDPQIIQENINKKVAVVNINFAEPIASLINVTVYYAMDGTGFTPANSISKNINVGETSISLDIYRQVSALRYDVGNSPGLEFIMNSIVLSNGVMPGINLFTFSAMSIYRICFLFVFFAFLMIHFIVNISVLYNVIFRYRYVIAGLIFVLLVANKINFSSVGMFNNNIQPNYNSEFSTPIFGTPRAIRSDEWVVSTPNRLSAQYPPSPYGLYNDIARGAETENVPLRAYVGYATLANPLNFGLLLGPEYGESVWWCGTLILAFMISLEMMYIVSKKNRVLAVTGACLIAFSPFYQWWSYGGNMLITGMGCLVCLYYFIRLKERWGKILCALGLSILFSQFVTSFYPPWQVPAGYLFIGLLVWIFYESWPQFRALKKIDWGIIGLALVFSASIIIAYIVASNNYMAIIANTVYPGTRTTLTGGGIDLGFAIDKLINGGFFPVLSFFTSFANTNVCQFSGFLTLFPIPLLFSYYMMRKGKRIDLLNMILIVFSLVMGTYVFISWPTWLAKITLMSYVQSVRALDVISFAQVFLLISSLSRFSAINSNKGKTFSWGLLIDAIATGICLLFAALYFIKSDLVSPINPLYIIIIFAGFTLVIYCMFKQCYTKSIAKAVCIFLVVFSCLSGLPVNPIMKGMDTIYAKPLAAEVEELSKNTDEKWVALGNIVEPQFLIACGASTINSTNIYPNLTLWEKLDTQHQYEDIYNRYAHVLVNLTSDPTRFELQQADVIKLYLSYDDLEIANVKYVLSQTPLENQDNVKFELLYAEDGSFIYQADYGDT